MQAIIGTHHIKIVGLIAIAGSRKLYIYRYDIKKDINPPTLSAQSEISPSEPIHSIKFIKSLGLFIFMEFSVHFYRIDWIHDLPELVHTLHYPYTLKLGMKLFKIPSPPAG